MKARISKDQSAGNEMNLLFVQYSLHAMLQADFSQVADEKTVERNTSLIHEILDQIDNVSESNAGLALTADHLRVMTIAFSLVEDIIQSTGEAPAPLDTEEATLLAPEHRAIVKNQLQNMGIYT